jgi:uncharacterized protein DUF3826
MKVCLLAWGSLFFATVSMASTPPSEDSTYIRMITERAGKITATLGITDSTLFFHIRTLIADQYRALNAIYADRDLRLAAIKSRQPAPDKQTMDSSRSSMETELAAKLRQLHDAYLGRLGKELSPQQVDKVKDGMTYNVLEVTYRAYQEELPDLTAKQKATILADLTEAREFAMDAESSEKKHQWFGKYKGRINNYLSGEGIDMKKAGEEWRRRIAEKNKASSPASSTDHK